MEWVTNGTIVSKSIMSINVFDIILLLWVAGLRQQEHYRGILEFHSVGFGIKPPANFHRGWNIFRFTAIWNKEKQYIRKTETCLV